MKASVVFVALLVPLTTLASWHAGSQPRPGPAKIVAEPGWEGEGSPRRWQCVVLHHSGTEVGGAARFDAAHRARGWDELGYHFVIGNGTDTADGEIEVGSRWAAQKQGAHCKTGDEFYNEYGIGVCIVGNFDGHRPSAAQVRSVQRLVRYLCARYAIPVDRVLVHGGVTGKTRCPGEQFNLDAIRRAVR